MADSDIVLNVGFNQDDVDKEIDKLEKKMAKYNRSLELATKSVDELEKEYERINTNLEIEENLHGKNTKEVRSLKLELEDVNKKLQDEYAIMDSIKKKREETNSLYRQAHLDPASFSRNIKPSNSNKGEVLSIDSRGTDKLGNNSKKATSAVSTLRDAVGQANQRISGLRGIIASTTNVLSGFIGRVVGLAKRVFIFSVITMAFRHMRSGIADVIKGNDQLSASLETIKFNLQVAFLPIYNAILPALQSLINGLARATSYIAAFFNTLLGSNIKQSQQAVRTFNAQRASAENLSKSNRKLADSTRKMAGATKKANDQMNKQLAGFDELNNLSKDVSDDIDNLSNDLSKDQVPDSIVPNLQDAYSADMVINFDTSQAEQAAERFKEKLQPINKALEEQREKLSGVSSQLKNNLQWDYQNILVPLGNWSVSELAPAAINALGSAAGFLGKTLNSLQPSFEFFVNEILKPIGEWTGGIIIQALDDIAWAFDYLSKVIEENKDDINFCLQEITKVFRWSWDNSIKPLLDNIWNFIRSFFRNIINFIGDGIKNCTKILKGIIDFIEGVFTGDWKRAWNGIVNIFAGLINNMVANFEYVLRNIIGLVNIVIGNVNSGLHMWNKIPGINIPDIPKIPEITLPRVPYLAQGAVIPPNREFLAVLGDQKRGTNIEAPLDTIKQALSEVMAEYSNDSEYTFIAQIDGRTLFKETVKQDQMFKKQSGRSAFAY